MDIWMHTDTVVNHYGCSADGHAEHSDTVKFCCYTWRVLMLLVLLLLLSFK